jgi:hypothetical protein
MWVFFCDIGSEKFQKKRHIFYLYTYFKIRRKKIVHIERKMIMQKHDDEIIEMRKQLLILLDDLEEKYSSFTERIKFVLARRFGFRGEVKDKRSFEAIGKELQITNTTVQAYLSKGMRIIFRREKQIIPYLNKYLELDPYDFPHPLWMDENGFIDLDRPSKGAVYTKKQAHNDELRDLKEENRIKLGIDKLLERREQLIDLLKNYEKKEHNFTEISQKALCF